MYLNLTDLLRGKNIADFCVKSPFWYVCPKEHGLWWEQRGRTHWSASSTQGNEQPFLFIKHVFFALFPTRSGFWVGGDRLIFDSDGYLRTRCNGYEPRGGFSVVSHLLSCQTYPLTQQLDTVSSRTMIFLTFHNIPITRDGERVMPFLWVLKTLTSASRPVKRGDKMG